MLNQYLSRKKTANEIGKINMYLYQLDGKIKKMRNASIVKPTEDEISSMISEVIDINNSFIKSFEIDEQFDTSSRLYLAFKTLKELDSPTNLYQCNKVIKSMSECIELYRKKHNIPVLLYNILYLHEVAAIVFLVFIVTLILWEQNPVFKRRYYPSLL